MEPKTDADALIESALMAWLQEQRAWTPPDTEAPDTFQLVAYISGVLPPQEARRIVQSLNASEEMLDRLDMVDTCLTDTRQLSSEEQAKRAAGTGLEADVARAWMAVQTQQQEATESARRHWLQEGWNTLQSQMMAGVEKAQEAWRVFQRGFGEQWKTDLLAPRLAHARGEGEDPVREGPWPDEVRLRVEAQIREDNALHVVLVVQDWLGRPSHLLAGRTVQLALGTTGETWPLETVTIAQEQAEWTLREYGRWFQLAPGPIPAEYLHLTLDSPPS